MTLGFQENFIKHHHTREDDWALKVQSHLSVMNDLSAEEALYHHTFKDLFMKGKPWREMLAFLAVSGH